jgi:hypothetical protein
VDRAVLIRRGMGAGGPIPISGIALLAACGGPPDPIPAPYASEVVSFEPGPGAGFGNELFPGIVLGAPGGAGTTAASLDVLSLGAGGSIAVGFEVAIVDEPGPDFVVFENAFWIRGDPDDPYAELGEVAVSTDAVSWRKFTCNRDGEGAGRWPGCAGWSPTLEFDPNLPLQPESCGGDAFDLADVGVAEARYVRIVDLDGGGEAPSIGFDLDAVGLVHHR